MKEREAVCLSELTGSPRTPCFLGKQFLALSPTNCLNSFFFSWKVFPTSLIAFTAFFSTNLINLLCDHGLGKPPLPTGLNELFPSLYEGYVNRGAWCEKGLGKGGLVLETSHLT